MRRDGRAISIDVVIEHIEQKSRLLKTLCVNVVKRNVRILQRFPAHAVAQNVLGENGTARTHKCDFRHATSLSKIRGCE